MGRKTIVLFSVLFCIFAFHLGLARTKEVEIKQQTTFTLPLSLQVIEEDAFSGTAAETVILPKGFLKIGEKAFEGAWRLIDIYIPDTTEYISDSSFSKVSDIALHGLEGSYAEEWANKHETPFVIDNVWYEILHFTGSKNTQVRPAYQSVPIMILAVFFALYGLSWYKTKSKRPQDRSELNPIDYCFP